MNTIKNALERCRTYVAVQKFGCGHTGIGHGVEDNLLQLLNEAFEVLAWLEKREPTLMSDCISAGLPLDVALKYDVQLCRLTNYVRDKALADYVKQEPVAFRTMELRMEPVAYGVKNTDEFLFFQNEQQAQHYADKWGFVVTPLYAAPVDAKAIRDEALKEAAKVCESTYPTYESDQLPCFDTPAECAAAIRGLK